MLLMSCSTYVQQVLLLHCRYQPYVVVFFTGADRIPPLGFPHAPSLHFLDDDAMLPTSSTCSLALRLPIHYTSYDCFKDAMTEGLVSNGGLDGGP